MKVRCERPGCKKSFELAQNKRFCSERCRVLRHYERVDEASRHLWHSLELINAEAAFKAKSESEWLKTVLTRNAPAGAAGYRLGCPNRFTDEESQYLRWFPSMDRVPHGMFMLNPFERPMIPAVGWYAVAFFDQELRMLGQPRYKIFTDWAQKNIKWSHGDRKVPILQVERG